MPTLRYTLQYLLSKQKNPGKPKKVSFHSNLEVLINPDVLPAAAGLVIVPFWFSESLSSQSSLREEAFSIVVNAAKEYFYWNIFFYESLTAEALDCTCNNKPDKISICLCVDDPFQC